MHNLLFAAVVRKRVANSGLGSILILKTLACYSSLCNYLKSFFICVYMTLEMQSTSALFPQHVESYYAGYVFTSTATGRCDSCNIMTKRKGCRGCNRNKGAQKW